MAKWRDMAGLVSVDGARQIESEVRAYANALAQLGNTAGELDSLRHELSDRIEPAVMRARTSLIEACATYGLDDVTVENGGVLVQCTPTFIGSSKNYKSRQLKSSQQFNNWRYTAKQSGAWYPRITTERMIFTTTSAHY